MSPRVLVAGGSGVVGRAAVDAFAGAPGWEVTGISRRPPDVAAGRHVALDLRDARACAERLAAEGPFSHLVYAALQESPGLAPGWSDRALMERNRCMLEVLLDALEPVGALRHVSLLQGAKAYGVHLHAARSPGRERDARDPHANFYWLQEDLLRERAASAGFGFTIWRPPVVYGHALRAPMNLLAAIGAFAALEKAAGRPLCWPGGATALTEGVDARLLARAFVWAATAPEALDQVFNVTNGDVFEWPDAWDAIARAMGMPRGEPRPQRLAETLPGRAEEWDRLVRAHDLRAPALVELVGDSLHYLDLLFGIGRERPAPPFLLSTVKLRRAGFHACMDSEQMFGEWLIWMQRQRILPPA